MKKSKMISYLSCVVLLIQSLLGANMVVFANEEIIDSSIPTEELTSSVYENTEMETSNFDETVSTDSNLEGETLSSDSLTSSGESQYNESVAEGTYGSVNWYISNEGVLTLESGMLPKLEKEEQDKSPWIEFSDIIHTIDIRGIIVSTEYGAESLFSGLINLIRINNLKQLDLSGARSIRQLFSQTALKEINVSDWDVSKIEDFSETFAGINVVELDLSNWNLLNTAKLKGIFNNVRITKLNIEDWNISESTWEGMTTSDSLIDEVIRREVEESISSDIEKETLLDETSNTQQSENKNLSKDFIELDVYGSIINNNYQLFSDKELLFDISDKYDLRNQTIHIKGSFKSESGDEYYYISNNKNSIGYINAVSVMFASGEQGPFNELNRYVTIIGSSPIWDGFSWENSHSPNKYKYRTLKARGIYYHFNGSKYLSLYDNHDNWIGYINENGTREVASEQGAFYSIDRFASLKGNSSIWDSFTWKNNISSNIYKNQTVKAKGIYYHFNGSRYLSLYDNKNHWIGYINENGTTTVRGEQGVYQAYDKYVVMNGSYDIWDSFEWKSKVAASKYKNQTFQAKGIYHHFNGSRYLSLYDNKGTWLGYINESGVTVAPGAQGIHQTYGKYVSIKGNYAIWDGFTWNNQTPGSKYKNQTLQAKGIYYHFNGSRYLSLYDSKGKWLGYMNESGAEVTKDKQGLHYSYNQLVKISANNPTIWKSFSFKDKVSGNHKNKMYLAKGYYNHFNGSRYLSLYNNGKWVGYINESSTTKARGAGSYLQTSREKVVASLNQNKNIYLGTPYRGLSTAPYHPERLMSPKGRPNGNPPAFNCTGFVGRAMRDAGGNLSKITSVANAWGGINNAYNWRDALVSKTDTMSFNTISDLLKSGLAKKGDIIYLEADFSKPGYDCHIGIFWGDTPTENKFWHSTIAGGGNNITHIFSGTPYSKAILIPMD